MGEPRGAVAARATAILLGGAACYCLWRLAAGGRRGPRAASGGASSQRTQEKGQKSRCCKTAFLPQYEKWVQSDLEQCVLQLRAKLQHCEKC
uniref:Uncharacterized protein n=1 Tax=Amazona collaria TaxID=241587 RepID=A0A8B9ISE2_9PSIT